MPQKFANLQQLTDYYNRIKPTNDGSENGAIGERNYWNEYKNDLEALHAEGLSGDYASYSTLRNYVLGQSNASEDYLSNLRLLAQNANNSKVQQSILKDQSLKRAQVSIDAAGLGGSGIGQSIQTGIGNQYGSQIGEIDRNLETNRQSAFEEYRRLAQEREIANEDSLNAQETERAQSNYALASEMLNSGVDIDTVLKNYGEGLTETQINSLRDISAAADGSAFATRAIQGSGFNLASLQEKMAGKSMKEQIQISVNMLGENLATTLASSVNFLLMDPEFQQNVTEGLVVQLTKKGDSSKKAFLVYHDGNWYPNSQSYFTKASNKTTIEK